MKILLTGPPGIGKTTVIQRTLKGIDLKAGGFFTQEMRREGRRIGFVLKTLEGEEGVLAHVDYKGKYRVGRYGVDLSLFEAMALPVLERALQEKEIIVIDEIGKMELLSQRFREVVIQILDQGQRHLLGVIHQKREPFADSIKKREDVEVTVVNYQNRDELPSQIIMRLKRQRG
ncbi:MAG: AAA family ATPase [Deltaproteobacteria bacterium]|nr:MAG: AAA family ATPase [Deltaproteobacteria bacterium]